MKEFSIIRQHFTDGVILHVRSNGIYGRLIRFCQDRFLYRLARDMGLSKEEAREVKSWGNHDAIIMWNTQMQVWTVGTAESNGNKIMIAQDYFSDMKKRYNAEFRLYYPINATLEQGEIAVSKWARCIFRTTYDYWAVMGYFFKAMLLDWTGVGWDWKKAYYCTEGVVLAWKEALNGRNILQDDYMMPFHVEQSAGELLRHPHKSTTLKRLY